MGCRRLTRLAGALIVAWLVIGAPRAATAQGPAPDPLVAPTTTLSPDGLTATDGQRSLSVSQVAGLPAGGQAVVVTGRGYDGGKGIYVALCLVPATNQPPTPCGGGADVDGATGASAWVSSNPPSYGEGLAIPYGPGGTFSLTLTMGPLLAGGLDCRLVRCAVVTRNDHTRSIDRSQDVFVPVTFAPTDPGATVPTAPPTTPAPTTTSTTTTTLPPSTVHLSDDGRLGTAADTTTTDALASPGATGDEQAAGPVASTSDASAGSPAGWLVTAAVVGIVVISALATVRVVARRRRGPEGTEA